MIKKERNIWIGIGADIKRDNKECNKINKLLCNKYKSLIKFSKDYKPHLNLYDLEVPKKNIKEVIDKIRKIALNKKGFEANIVSIDYFPWGLFFIKLQNNSQIRSLHEIIIKEVSKLKEDCICKDYLETKRHYNKKQKHMLKKYGNPHVSTLFKPHITLGLVKNKNLEQIKMEIKEFLTLKKFRIENINIVSEENKKKKVMASFKLKT